MPTADLPVDEKEVCGEEFYNCDDSTDDAPHRCNLPSHDTGWHRCECGVWGDC